MNKIFDRNFMDIYPYPYITDYKKKNKPAGKVEPLPPVGHLLNEPVGKSTVGLFKDFYQDIKNVGNGLNGKLDDNALGRLNDVGMKLGGLMTAIYLATRRASITQKVMEFIGGATFFSVMGLWPKIMIQKPMEFMHGTDFYHRYVDSFGRKKRFFLDPQYIPWDLYSRDDIEKMGDKMGIPRNLSNRQDTIRETALKKAIQANTLWMWTAGFATPLMTAMVCNAVQPQVAKIAEQYSTKKSRNELNNIDNNFHKYLNPKGKAKFMELLNSMEGNPIDATMLERLALELNNTTNVGAHVKVVEDLAKQIGQPTSKDLLVEEASFTKNLFGRKVRVANPTLKFYTTPHDELIRIINDFKEANDIKMDLINFFNNDIYKNSAATDSQSIMQIFDNKKWPPNLSADDISRIRKDMEDIIKKSMNGNQCNKKKLGDAFIGQIVGKPIQDLAPDIGKNLQKNIEDAIIKNIKDAKINYINSENKQQIIDIIRKSVAPLLKNERETNNLTLALSKSLHNLYADYNAPVLTPKIIQKLSHIYDIFDNVNARTKVINNHYKAHVGKKEDSTLALEWIRTINPLIKDLQLTNKEMEIIKEFYPYGERGNKGAKILMDRFEKIAGDEKLFSKVLTNFMKNIANYDKKFNFDLMKESYNSYKYIYNKNHEELKSIGFHNTAAFHAGEDYTLYVHKLRYGIFEALGLPENDFYKKNIL